MKIKIQDTSEDALKIDMVNLSKELKENYHIVEELEE